MSIDDDYRAIRSKYIDELFGMKNVVGVGLGGQTRGGKATGQPAIVVCVSRKRPAAEIASKDRIPRSLDGALVDVIEMGTPEEHHAPPTPTLADARTAQMDAREHFPLVGGTVVKRVTRGTMGCFVETVGETERMQGIAADRRIRGANLLKVPTVDQVPPGKIALLTNSHVASAPDEVKRTPGIGPTEDSICHGSTEISERVLWRAWWNINRANEFYQHQGDANSPSVDAAICELKPGTEYLAEVRDIAGPLTGSYEPTMADVQSLNYVVCQRGCWTGLTEGVVRVIDFTGEFQNITGSSRYTNQVLVIQPVHGQAVSSYHGDSGSVWINRDRKVVGLHWAGAVVPPSDANSIPETNRARWALAVNIFVVEKALAIKIKTAASAGQVQTA